VECADEVLINKCDLLPRAGDLELLKRVIESINPSANIISCVQGNVAQPYSILGYAGGSGVVRFGLLDEHKTLINVVSEKKGKDCNDMVCTDPTHNHDHSHSHAHDSHAVTTDITTAQERFGITSFVYKRRHPFHPIRFTRFLQDIGKLSIDGVVQMSSVEKSSDDAKSALRVARRSLLRSKGFVWMATSGAAAYFMSHAGQFLELGIMGRWWADIPTNEWPLGLEEEIRVDFDGEYGDRRQELVFIGQFEREQDGGKPWSNSQKALEDVLDSCLLNDVEMQTYEEQYAKGGDAALRKAFVPS